MYHLSCFGRWNWLVCLITPCKRRPPSQASRPLVVSCLGCVGEWWCYLNAGRLCCLRLQAQADGIADIVSLAADLPMVASATRVWKTEAFRSLATDSGPMSSLSFPASDFSGSGSYGQLIPLPDGELCWGPEAGKNRRLFGLNSDSLVRHFHPNGVVSHINYLCIP